MNARSIPSRGHATPLTGLLAACAAMLLAGCGQASAAHASATPRASAAETPSGPQPYAAWTARQGFGGGSGLHDVLHNALWLQLNWRSTSPFDVQMDFDSINRLVSWLDLNPATSCWATYHDAVHADLVKLQPLYASAAEARKVSGDIGTTADQIVSVAQAASDVPTPSNCP